MWKNRQLSQISPIPSVDKYELSQISPTNYPKFLQPKRWLWISKILYLTLVIDSGNKNEVRLFQVRPRQSSSFVFVENLVTNIVLIGRLLPASMTTFDFGLISSASDNNST
jgi:hypothetical protein